MTYEEAREFIDGSSQYGSKLGLTSVTELLRRLDNPQNHLKVIHVAGTNGKGSTAAFISTILAAEGYRVGRYISPAVFSYFERIQISYSAIFNQAGQSDGLNQGLISGKVYDPIINDGNDLLPAPLSLHTDFITEQGVADAIAMIQPVCEAMVMDGFDHPTSFEIETAMAFLYLFREQVDFAVIEVGLGGRLDATNVISQPICSVITSVSMDHMQYLGDSIEQITREKAGIIKKGVPVVTGNKDPRVLGVLEQASKEQGANLIIEREDITKVSYALEFTEFYRNGEKLRIGLLGEYQISNAVLAVRTAYVLRNLGYTIKENSIIDGLLQTRWSGRFEIINKNPYFIIDGAHNEDAALQLRKSLLQYFLRKKLIFIMGVLADKEYKKILKITAPLAKELITLTPNNSRALDSTSLAKEAKQYTDGEVIDAGNVSQAVKAAYALAGKEDIIVAFGSLSYLGELCENITELITELKPQQG